MLFVGLDKDGNQHCWKCGGQAFTQERITRVSVAPGAPSTSATHRLRCVRCGQCSDLGSAMEYA